jgi:hypothetical protein
MFPLAILPLPDELVPLHIFEPRYKQLLNDAETLDIRFGIYCSHVINEEKIGSLVRLERIIKRYAGGECDIIVKCEDVFHLHMLLRTFKDKMYPGGDVQRWHVEAQKFPGAELYEIFLEYLNLRNIKSTGAVYTIYQVAHELMLDVHDRYKFLFQSEPKKETFLLNRVRYQIDLLKREDKSKDLYHLN